MLDPSHPGESILLGCLGKGLDAGGAAALLGIPRAVLDEVLAGRASVTPELARRMAVAAWSSATFRLRRQAAWDPAGARAAAA